jgi:hypothetical protein
MGWGVSVQFSALAIDRSAVARALNQTTVSVQKMLVERIAEDTGLPPAAVNKRLVRTTAKSDALEATIAADRTKVPLIDFGASGPEPSRGAVGGVSVRLRGGHGTYPHAFLATMRTGHRGVFQRVGGARLPIRELRGPSVWLVGRKFSAAVEAFARQQFPANLEAQDAFAGIAG